MIGPSSHGSPCEWQRELEIQATNYMVVCPIEAAQCDAHRDEKGGRERKKNTHNDSYSLLLTLLEGGKGYSTYSYHTSHSNAINFLFILQI